MWRKKSKPLPTVWNRQRAHQHLLDSNYLRETLVEFRPLDDPQANLVLSKIENSDLHAPALDLDVPCELVKSHTQGHYHLYIDVPMTKEDYFKLLGVLVDVGLVEQAFYDMSRRSGFSSLRAPGVLKYEIERAREGTAAMLRDLDT